MKKKKTSSGGMFGWISVFVVTALVAAGSVFFVDLGPDKKKKPSTPPSSLPSLSPPPVAEETPDLSSLLPGDEQDLEHAKQSDQEIQEAAETPSDAASQDSETPSNRQGTGSGEGQAAPEGLVTGVVGLEKNFDLPVESNIATAFLEKSTFCRDGRFARRAPSLFGVLGFAITYGAETFEGGEDPFPRLEIFINEVGGQRFVSYMSLSLEKVPGFPNNQETAILWDEKALLDIIFRWSKGASNDTCPVKKET